MKLESASRLRRLMCGGSAPPDQLLKHLGCAPGSGFALEESVTWPLLISVICSSLDNRIEHTSWKPPHFLETTTPLNQGEARNQGHSPGDGAGRPAGRRHRLTSSGEAVKRMRVPSKPTQGNVIEYSAKC